MSSPILLLSSFDEQERRKLTSLVEKLGGRVLQSVGYDQRCTHIVIGAILSTEKLLAGSIAGKWIVRSEYVEKCYKARKWLPAEMFPLKPGGGGSGGGNAKKLSEVPSRWRDYRVTNGNQGPFKSWTVLLALSEVDRIRYKRLLQAGGAHVISDKPPYVWSLMKSDSLSYVFTDKTLFSSVLSFHKKGVPCLHPDYIKDFIIQQQSPIVVTYKADEYIPPVKVTNKSRTILSYMDHSRKSFVMDNAQSPSYMPDKVTVLSFKKCRKKSSCGAGKRMPTVPTELKLSIPLDRISLRSCQPLCHQHQADDAIIDLTDVMSQPASGCVTLQPPSHSQPSSDSAIVNCIVSQQSLDTVTVSTKCTASQSSSDCIATPSPINVSVSQPSSSNCVIVSSSTVTASNCFIVPSHTGCAMSQTSLGCVTSSATDCTEPPSDSVSTGFAPSQTQSDVILLSTGCAVLEPSSDCVITSSTQECTTSTSPSSVAEVFSNPADTSPPQRRARKRKRKPLLSLDLLQEQQGEVLSLMTSAQLDDTTQSLSRAPHSKDASLATILLHRQLWTQTTPPPVVGKGLTSSVECLLEGYLCEQQSAALLIRGLEYSYTLLAHCTPSATILHQLAKILMSGKIDYKIAAMVLTKLLLRHPPRGIAREQYCKLFELFGGNNKWEGLVQGIIDDQPHLLHYMTDILLLDYYMWLTGSHTSQPLLHEVIWGWRSCDVACRALQELFQHLVTLLASYSPDKYSKMESLCYLAYLTSHYLQQQSATPPSPATPPNLQAAVLCSSSHARDSLISAINSFHMIDDYKNYQQCMI